MTKRQRGWFICGTYTIGTVVGVASAMISPWYYVTAASCAVYLLVCYTWGAFS